MRKMDRYPFAGVSNGSTFVNFGSGESFFPITFGTVSTIFTPPHTIAFGAT